MVTGVLSWDPGVDELRMQFLATDEGQRRLRRIDEARRRWAQAADSEEAATARRYVEYLRGRLEEEFHRWVEFH